MKQAVILLSGGLDSATCAAIAQAEGFDLIALSFDYGQRHLIETDAAKSVVSALNIASHHIVTIDPDFFKGSSLTDTIPIPKNCADQENIPNTYVPARNTLFLSYALALAESREIRDIYIGVTAVDYSGYPDCRADYIAAYETMANLATKIGREGKKIRIHTPIINMKKSAIIRRGTELHVPYHLTHSCYDPTQEGFSCGICDSCIHRHRGFTEAQIDDPTRYALPH